MKKLKELEKELAKLKEAQTKPGIHPSNVKPSPQLYDRYGNKTDELSRGAYVEWKDEN